MADYVSNCPISALVNPGWKPERDIGGMSWSDDNGMFFDVQDEELPIRVPNRLGR